MILLRLLRLFNRRTWILLLLLALAISSVFFGFREVVRFLDRVPWAAILIIGLLAGWLAGRKSLKLVWALSFFILTGLVFVFVHFGSLFGPLFALERAWAGSVVRFADNLLQWGEAGLFVKGPLLAHFRSLLPDPAPLLLAAREVGTAINVVVFHLDKFLVGAQQGEWIVDKVAIGFIWSLVFWLGTSWTIYAAMHFNSPLLGLSPLLLGIAFTMNYVHARPYPLLGVIFATLMATAFSRHFADETRWQRERTDYADYLTQDTGFTSLFLTVVIVLFAFLASLPPILTLQEIQDFLNQFRNGQQSQEVDAARSLGLEARPEPVSRFAEWQEGGLPRQHLLGSGPELSERVVMTVQVEQELQTNAPSRAYYWRALTYDQYTGRGWVTSATQDKHYSPRQMVLTVASFRSISITSRFERVEDTQNLLFAPGLLVSADRSFDLALRPVPDAPEISPIKQSSNPPDIFASRIDAKNYRVSSLLPVVSTKTLREASSIYPDWVRSRYLDYPVDLPDRLVGLVLELTQDAPDQFAKAQAIESYLRTIPYSLDIPVPDPFVDVVDFFLFDLKKGYCDYYATAMAVMSRVAGLPSRLVVGYASGSYDPINRRFVVTEADAHSWVEIYFPGTGWVEFEPTASRQEILIPEEGDLADQANITIPTPPSRLGLPSLQEMIGWGIIAFITVGGFILIWNTLESWRLRRLGAVNGLRRIFQQLYHSSSPILGKTSPGATPLEYSINLQQRLQKGFRIPGWEDNLPATLKSLRLLTALYIQAIYSPSTPSFKDLKGALQQWKFLRHRLWLAGFANHYLSQKPRKHGKINRTKKPE